MEVLIAIVLLILILVLATNTGDAVDVSTKVESGESVPEPISKKVSILKDEYAFLFEKPPEKPSVKKDSNLMFLNDDTYNVTQGTLLYTVKEAYCETGVHYSRYEKIPIGKIVEVNRVWRNCYGKFINVTYDGKTYDIQPNCVVYYEGV